jgi:serine O-acetyltransferase
MSEPRHAPPSPGLRGFLRETHRARAGYPYPCDLRTRVERVTVAALALMFPHFAGDVHGDEFDIEREYRAVEGSLALLIEPFGEETAVACARAAERFLEALPRLRDALLLDAQAMDAGDPAAESLDEVILAYPGFYAVAVYRMAHELQRAGVRVLPRLFTEHAHGRTGIDIHPAARIGERFCIDHGTGIVIGATTDIGADVKLYQGVTLGALSVSKNLAGAKRHPTLEDEVIVYSNATILGGSTVIGRGSVIGGNVWLTESVPPNALVTRKSDVRVRTAEEAGIEYHI